MQKYNKAEGKLEVLVGRASHVLNDHFRRTGKYSLSKFTEKEREAFEEDLLSAQKEDEAEAQVSEPKPAAEKVVDKSASEPAKSE